MIDTGLSTEVIDMLANIAPPHDSRNDFACFIELWLQKNILCRVIQKSPSLNWSRLFYYMPNMADFDTVLHLYIFYLILCL